MADPRFHQALEKLVDLNKDKVKSLQEKLLPERDKIFSDIFFDNMLQECFVAAMDTFYKQGELTPSLMVVMEDGSREVYSPDNFWNSQQEGLQLFRAMGAKAFLEHKTPYLMYFVSEAWGKKMDKDEAKKFLADSQPVSAMDDKDELLMMNGAALDGRTNMATAKIIRTGDTPMFETPDFVLYENRDKAHLDIHVYTQAFIDAYLSMRIVDSTIDKK